MTQRRWLTAVALGAVISALFWIDPLFIPLALLGPIVVGAIAGVRAMPWRWPAAVFVVAGLGAVVSDWIANQEDVPFHLVLTVVMMGLALGGFAVARASSPCPRSRPRRLASRP